MVKTGEKWERKVGSIFENAGFSCVEQPDPLGKLNPGHFCYGKLNPELQPDIVVRVDKHRWVLVECRDRRNPTIRNWLHDIKGRTVDLRSRLIKDTKSRQTHVYGVAATSLKRLENKMHEVAQNTEVALWHHGFVDYLLAISKGARSQVKDVVLYRSGIRQSSYPPIKLTVPPSQIARAAFVYHRGPGCDDRAYQRLLNPNRIREIAGFVNRGNIFPNSIVMALPTAGVKCPSTNSDDGLVTITIPGDPEGIKIIDGQHRFFGALASGRDPRLLTTFVECDELTQAIMFATVNGKQVSVKKGELIALFGIPNFAAQIAAGVSEKDRERIELEEAIYRTLERLDAKAPLFERLNFYPGRPSQDMIPFKFIYDSIMRIARIEQSGYPVLKGSAIERGKQFGTSLANFLNGWMDLLGEKQFYDEGSWFQPTMLSALLLTYPECRQAIYPDEAEKLLRNCKAGWKAWRPRPESYRGAAGATILAKALCRRLGIKPRFL